MFYKKGIKSDNSFDIFNYFLMLFACFITLYPFWFVIVNSLNDGTDGLKGGIYWWPRVFTLENYRIVFINPDILSSFEISVLRTVIGTSLAVFFTAMVAYAFSKNG
jgi:putative aldouronate transport system permease protein